MQPIRIQAIGKYKYNTNLREILLNHNIPATMPFKPLFPSPVAAAAPKVDIHGLWGNADIAELCFLMLSICYNKVNNTCYPNLK